MIAKTGYSRAEIALGIIGFWTLVMTAIGLTQGDGFDGASLGLILGTVIAIVYWFTDR